VRYTVYNDNVFTLGWVLNYFIGLFIVLFNKLVGNFYAVYLVFFFYFIKYDEHFRLFSYILYRHNFLYNFVIFFVFYKRIFYVSNYSEKYFLNIYKHLFFFFKLTSIHFFRDYKVEKKFLFKHLAKKIKRLSRKIKCSTFKWLNIALVNNNSIYVSRTYKSSLLKYFLVKNWYNRRLFNDFRCSLTQRIALNFRTYINEAYHLFLKKFLYKYRRVPYLGNRKNFFYNLKKKFLEKLRLTRLLHWNIRRSGKLNKYRYDKLLAFEMSNLQNMFFINLLGIMFINYYCWSFSWGDVRKLIKLNFFFINGVQYKNNFSLVAGDLVELPFGFFLNIEHFKVIKRKLNKFKRLTRDFYFFLKKKTGLLKGLKLKRMEKNHYRNRDIRFFKKKLRKRRWVSDKQSRFLTKKLYKYVNRKVRWWRFRKRLKKRKSYIRFSRLNIKDMCVTFFLDNYCIFAYALNIMLITKSVNYFRWNYEYKLLYSSVMSLYNWKYNFD
jgi:hypothetical protein